MVGTKYRDRIKNLAILCSEYTLPKRTRYTRKRELYAFSDIVVTHTLLLSKKKNHRFLVYADKTWYHIYNHITDVHLSMWSSIVISLIIIRIGVFDLGNSWYRYLYIVDIVYWIKIIINFHLTYYDRETGILVTNHTYIAKRYLKSWSGFWLDIITTFPFEVFVMGFKSASLVHGCCMNRILRFIFIFIYYGTWKKRLTMTRLQRWIYLIYIIILMIHSTTCFWWLVACPQQMGTQIWTNNYLQYERVKIKKPLLSFMLSIFHIVNIFTSTGFKIMAPDTVKELGAMIFIICAGQFTAMVLTICFANMIVLKKFMMSEYERKAKHIWLFMQATNVSTSLRTKVWSYFVSLWIRGYGSWLPDLIRDAPNNLKQKIMCELYGRYLGINCLFKGTHIDFLRQLAMHLEPNEFLPGMYIVEKGDVDACMYFIQKGEIIVFDKHGNNEIEQATLRPDESFGELQGIYGIPHDRSYKARFHSQVLRLQKSDWIELLQWFPASKDSIQDAINLHFRKTDTFI